MASELSDDAIRELVLWASLTSLKRGKIITAICRELLRLRAERDAAVAEAVRVAVAEEREQCAILAETMPRVWDIVALPPQQRIAAAIRRRE